MTKSRTLPALLLLALTVPVSAVAQPGLPQDEPPLPQPGTPDQPTLVTADEAIAMAGARTRDIVETECPQGQLEEVVVCGRRPGYQRWRVPFRGPDVSPGTRARAGDAQLYAMDAGG